MCGFESQPLISTLGFKPWVFIRMSRKNWREWLLGAVIIGGIAAAFSFSPIPQDPVYHEFADRRTLFGTPNFWNVFSNLSFVLVGAFGLSRLSRLQPSSPRSAYVVFCVGVVFVGFGSAYYHYSPSTHALVWDRLPMTVAFMALFSMVVHDRISEQLGNGMLWSLVLAGVASVGVLVLVRTPGPRGPQGVRGNTVSTDATNAIDAHNLHRQRIEYPMAVGHIWDLRLDQSGGAL